MPLFPQPRLKQFDSKKKGLEKEEKKKFQEVCERKRKKGDGKETFLKSILCITWNKHGACFDG